MPTDDEIEALIARGAPAPSAATRDRVLMAAYAARTARRAPRVRWWALAAALAITCDAGYVFTARPPRPPATPPVARQTPPRDVVELAALIARVGADAAAREVAP